MDKAKLAELLRRAETAHAQYEKTLGHSDPNWPEFYAAFLMDNLFPTPAPITATEANIQHIREDIRLQQDNDNADE